MDINATLHELRALVNVTGQPTEDEWNRLRELFLGLDDWLMQGGFLPKDWDPQAEPVTESRN